MLRVKELSKDLKVVGLDGGGIVIYHYKERPFSGVVYDEEDGYVAWEVEYKEGYQEGWVKYYFRSGKLRQESKKHNNEIIEGTFKEWDENGNLILSF